MWRNSIITALLVLQLVTPAKAQVGFIWDLITGDLSNAVVDGLDYAGDKYWENVSEEAKKLLEIEIDKSKLSAVDYKYGMTDPSNAYNSIGGSLNGDINNFYEKYTTKIIALMGNGKISQHINESIDASKNKYVNYSILSDKTKSLLDGEFSEVKQSVYDDVDKDPMLGRLINVSPESYLDYYKKTRATNLKSQKNLMCYFCDIFDVHPNNWPESKQFAYTNKDLHFVQSSNNTFVNDASGNVLMGFYGFDQIVVSCNELSFLNHNLIPNVTTHYESMELVTDGIGRICIISANLKKGKNKVKTEITKKDLLQAGKKLLYVVPKKYNGPLCMANVYPMPFSKDNKKTLKALNKQISKMENPYISARIEYLYTSSTIQRINISCNGTTYGFEM